MHIGSLHGEIKFKNLTIINFNSRIDYFTIEILDFHTGIQVYFIIYMTISYCNLSPK